MNAFSFAREKQQRYSPDEVGYARVNEWDGAAWVQQGGDLRVILEQPVDRARSHTNSLAQHRSCARGRACEEHLPGASAINSAISCAIRRRRAHLQPARAPLAYDGGDCVSLTSACTRAGTWWGAAAVPAGESLCMGAWCASEDQQPAGRIAAPLIRRHRAQCDRVALTCGEGYLTHRRQLAVTRVVESDAWEIGGRSA